LEHVLKCTNQHLDPDDANFDEKMIKTTRLVKNESYCPRYNDYLLDKLII